MNSNNAKKVRDPQIILCGVFLLAAAHVWADDPTPRYFQLSSISKFAPRQQH
jgi:hypothetical protein